MDTHLFIWNPWGLFGLAGLIACVGMGAFVLVTRPDRTQNRRLAMLLAIEGVITFGGPSGAAFAGSAASARIFFAIHFVGLFLLVPILFRFLATIETPLSRPLATRSGAVLPWLFAAAEIAVLITRPALLLHNYRKASWDGWMFDGGPLTSVAYAISGVALTYSVLVAISAYRRAAVGSTARERARRYAIAFGFNDGLTIVVTTIVPGVYNAIHGADLRPIEFLFIWSFPIVETIFVGLMAYGILRTQLFDIDVRLVAGLRRGVLAAIVLFAFFASAEIAERLVSEQFGYIIGAFAAAALIFVHKPVERFAEGLSRTVLPAAEASPEYFAFRKLEVYREALEAAYEDGQLSKEDRLILKRLQTKLRVAADDAARLEEDARQALSHVAG
jgi:hypothetical protein